MGSNNGIDDQKQDLKKSIKTVKELFLFWTDMIKESSELRWTETPQKPGFKGDLGVSSYKARLVEVEDVICLLS